MMAFGEHSQLGSDPDRGHQVGRRGTTNNPAFGLNALGGAVTVQMKDGFSWLSGRRDLHHGRFLRPRSEPRRNGASRSTIFLPVYGALEGLHDDGFLQFLSQSDVRRFYSDIGYRNDGNEFHLNMGLADNNFGATATVPIELLQQYWGATYTTPQTTANQVGYLNLTGKVEATPTWTIDGIAHFRAFSQQVQDGNPTGTQPCTADATLLCFGDGSSPANGLNGMQLSNPFAPGAFLGEIDRTTTRSTTGGLSPCRRPTPTSSLGTTTALSWAPASIPASRISAPAPSWGPSARIMSSAAAAYFSDNPAIPFRSARCRCEPPINTRESMCSTPSMSPRRLRDHRGREIQRRAHPHCRDQIGTQLNGIETFDRFNPIIGGTYKINSGLTAYAGYSEANLRAEPPLEPRLRRSGEALHSSRRSWFPIRR